MPDVKLAVVTEGKEQILAVGAYPGYRGTLAHSHAIHLQLRVAKLHSLLVKGYTHQIIAQLAVVVEHIVNLGRVGQRPEARHVSLAIIYLLAVGGPCGEGFHGIGSLAYVAHLMSVGIVEDEVAAIVEHLNLFKVLHVEGLTRAVAGEDNVILLGVPRRIDGRAQY